MLIAQCLGDSGWGSVGPDLLREGCGGRELCVLALSQRWAAAGHHVTNLVPREDTHVVQWASGGREVFSPVDGAVHALRAVRFDGIVSVELPELLLDVGARDTQLGVPQFVHHQVCHSRPDAVRASRAHVERHGSLPFRWSGLSPWHSRFLSAQLPGDAPVTFPNGCFSAQLRPPTGERAPRGPAFHWGSSPDRGLSHVARAWPSMRKRLPGATLDVLYGVERYLSWATGTHYRDAEEALWVARLLDMDGVRYRGLVGREELTRVLQSSSALLYPCDPASPTESGCITAIEAAAAGSVPVLSDADCLEEEFGAVAPVLRLPVSTDALVDAAERAMEERSAREPELLEFAASRDWEVISKQWLDAFESNAA